MNKYVYHGSNIENLNIISPSYSKREKKYIYGSYSKAIATIFLSKMGNDLYYFLGGSGSIADPVIIIERKPNTFKHIFNISGSIYKLDSTKFKENMTGWSAEVVSEEENNVIKEYKVKNVYKELIKISKGKKFKLYLYPDRPSFIPLDNSDLIPKVKKWEQRGINISEFFKMYPELKEKFDTYINK